MGGDKMGEPRMTPLLRLVFLLIPILALLPEQGVAGRSVGICDRAAEGAAKSSGVPVDVLKAITRVEAGRSTEAGFSGWPWTVNQAGDGSFFDSKAAAMDHVQRVIDRGETNIDIGCFQINIRWHSKAFASLEHMFDPDENAIYAASFLQRLHDESGSWEAAIGAYHSRRDEAAEGYLAKVVQVMDDLPLTHSGAAPEQRSGGIYPLFGGGGGALGSLVAGDARAAAAPLLR